MQEEFVVLTKCKVCGKEFSYLRTTSYHKRKRSFCHACKMLRWRDQQAKHQVKKSENPAYISILKPVIKPKEKLPTFAWDEISEFV